MQRMDWEAQSSSRLVGLAHHDVRGREVAERIRAPAMAAPVEGGVGDQKSSQISAAKLKSARSEA